MSIPLLPIPNGVTAPTGYSHFIGYHGTSTQTATAALAHADISILVGTGEMGSGFYVTSDVAAAQIYADGKQGSNQSGQVLHVFCDGTLATSTGQIFNAANYTNPKGMNLPLIIPPQLLTVPFLRDFNIPAQIKINLPFLAHVAFVQ